MLLNRGFKIVGMSPFANEMLKSIDICKGLLNCLNNAIESLENISFLSKYESLILLKFSSTFPEFLYLVIAETKFSAVI